MSDQYDVGLICLNGHDVNPSSFTMPQFNTKFCEKCGTATINQYSDCSAMIRGFYRDSWALGYVIPSYCHECGKPYPWTQSRLEAASEMIDLFDEIDESDKQKLKDSLPDLAQQTPKSDVAAKRWQMIAKKVGGDVYDALIKVGTDAASEYTKKLLGGQP